MLQKERGERGILLPPTPRHPQHADVSSCAGQPCALCGGPATHQLVEAAAAAGGVEGQPGAYLCCSHFRAILGPAASCPPEQAVAPFARTRAPKDLTDVELIAAATGLVGPVLVVSISATPGSNVATDPAAVVAHWLEGARPLPDQAAMRRLRLAQQLAAMITGRGGDPRRWFTAPNPALDNRQPVETLCGVDLLEAGRRLTEAAAR